MEDIATEEKARALAKDPTNRVFYYKGGERLDSVVPLSTVKQNVGSLWARVQVLRAERYDINRAYALLSTEFTRFSETHPLIFDHITRPETSQKDIDMIVEMIALKKAEPGDAGRTLLAKRVMDEFAMSKQEWDAKYGTTPMYETKNS